MPSAIIRADRVHIDHQKRGFFRIGLLPMMALERLRLELCDTNHVPTVLADLSARLSSDHESADAVEGRDFSLSFTGQSFTTLQSRTIRLGNRATWFLEEGIIQEPGAPPIPFRKAALNVTGPKAGELTFQTASGVVRIQLSSLSLNTEREPVKR